VAVVLWVRRPVSCNALAPIRLLGPSYNAASEERCSWRAFAKSRAG